MRSLATPTLGLQQIEFSLFPSCQAMLPRDGQERSKALPVVGKRQRVSWKRSADPIPTRMRKPFHLGSAILRVAQRRRSWKSRSSCPARFTAAVQDARKSMTRDPGCTRTAPCPRAQSSACQKNTHGQFGNCLATFCCFRSQSPISP